MTTLQPGDKAPSFSAVDQHGNTHKLSDYKGKNVILFFYPRASTPTCTVEACNLRDNYGELEKKGYVLLGVSADDVKAQAKFSNKHNLPFPLLADVDKKIVNAYGVWGPKKFMGLEFDGIHRTTFVIDGEQKIARVISKVKSKDHAAQILEG
jgi:peroxiredoxin Q/BCP